MPAPWQSWLDRLRSGAAHPSPSPAELHARLHQLRRERSRLLAQVGEEVAVWHRAGGEQERLLTEQLRDTLEMLGMIEEEMTVLLAHLPGETGGLPGEDYAPGGTMLADADGQPQVIRSASETPDPA